MAPILNSPRHETKYIAKQKLIQTWGQAELPPSGNTSETAMQQLKSPHIQKDASRKVKLSNV